MRSESGHDIICVCEKNSLETHGNLPQPDIDRNAYFRVDRHLGRA